MLSPAVRALDLSMIGGVTYHLVRQTNNSQCPSTFSMGAGTRLPGVPSATARFFSGDEIREGTIDCTGGGLLAVPVETLRSVSDMARLGEPNAAANLTGNEWSAQMVEWASVVGLRADTWSCAGESWKDFVFFYFGDASTRFRNTDSGAVTALPEGQRYLLLASPDKLFCILSAPAASRPTDGGGLPKGAIIAIAVAAVGAAAAAAVVAAVVLRRKRRRGAAAAAAAVGDGLGESNNGQGGSVSPPPPPPSPPFPSAYGVGVAGAPGGGATWAPWVFSSARAPPAPSPVAAAVPLGAGAKDSSPEHLRGGWAPPPPSLMSALTMTPPDDGWDKSAVGGGSTVDSAAGDWKGAVVSRCEVAGGDPGVGSDVRGGGQGGGGGGRGGSSPLNDPLTPPPMPRELLSQF